MPAATAAIRPNRAGPKLRKVLVRPFKFAHPVIVL